MENMIETFTKEEQAIFIVALFLLLFAIVMSYAMVQDYRIYLDGTNKARYSFCDFIKRGRYYIYLFLRQSFVIILGMTVYLTASVETRAKRRYQELQEKGEDCNLEEIAHDIEERDRRDMTREIAPLKQAEDAVLVDSSDMTITEVVKTIVDLCR